MKLQDTIFLTARDMADPAERAAYLAQACGKDADLRQRVEAMLRSYPCTVSVDSPLISRLWMFGTEVPPF